jgi:purine nucleosidase
VTDRTARELSERLVRQGAGRLVVHQGAAAPITEPGMRDTNAVAALIEALAAGPMTIMAFGPLTNVAAALEARPDLRGNVERIIAVMGRRPGHLFHPAEGAGRGMLFGHGPIFRDFNVAMDPDAVEIVIGLHVPLVLVPYEAARDVEIDGAALDRIAGSGPANEWVASRARSWLRYWQTAIGRDGFYPFDLVAAIFAVEPQRFACVDVEVELGDDRTLYPPFRRWPALLVASRADPAPAAEAESTLYCHSVREGFAHQAASELAHGR